MYIMCVFSFSWTKDGTNLTHLTFSEDSIKLDAANGTLTIKFPGVADEGLYQCFARAAFGTVAGLSVQLRHACKSSTVWCIKQGR